jgi:hypothetical protein
MRCPHHVESETTDVGPANARPCPRSARSPAFRGVQVASGKDRILLPEIPVRNLIPGEILGWVLKTCPSNRCFETGPSVPAGIETGETLVRDPHYPVRSVQ